jgi:2'-5' RNA ligase
MDEKSYYLLALFDGETQSRLRALGELLRENGCEGKNMTPDFPYHITLNGPEPSPDARFCARAAEVCRRTEAFEIGLGHVGLFGLAVLFLAPTPSEALLRLVNALFGGTRNDRADGWVPHVTMCMDDPEVVEKAVPLLARRFAPFQARVERVALYEFSPARRVAEYALLCT